MATTADLEGIRNCLADAFAPFESAYTAAAFQDTVPSVEALRHRLERMTVFVAERDGQICGTIGAQVLEEAQGYLRGMAVSPATQRLGIGDALLNAAIEHLRSAGCRSVKLATAPFLTSAIRLYVKCGFRRSERLINYFSMSLLQYERSL